MVNSSCGTLAVGSDQPASDQGYAPGRSGDCESLRAVLATPSTSKAISALERMITEAVRFRSVPTMC